MLRKCLGPALVAVLLVASFGCDDDPTATTADGDAGGDAGAGGGQGGDGGGNFDCDPACTAVLINTVIQRLLVRRVDSI